MTRLFIFIIGFCVSITAYSINPAEQWIHNFDNGDISIDSELSDLNEINNLVIENNYNYTDLSENHSSLISEAKLSHKAARNIFEGHPDNPLGVPAFWWGCCLAWVGMLIVYLFMDEGEQRKEEVRKALIGCMIPGVLYVMFYLFVIIANLN